VSLGVHSACTLFQRLVLALIHLCISGFFAAGCVFFVELLWLGLFNASFKDNGSLLKSIPQGL